MDPASKGTTCEATGKKETHQGTRPYTTAGATHGEMPRREEPSQHHNATDFCAKPMLVHGARRGPQFSVLSKEEVQELWELGQINERLNFTPQA